MGQVESHRNCSAGIKNKVGHGELFRVELVLQVQLGDSELTRVELVLLHQEHAQSAHRDLGCFHVDQGRRVGQSSLHKRRSEEDADAGLHTFGIVQ